MPRVRSGREHRLLVVGALLLAALTVAANVGLDPESAAVGAPPSPPGVRDDDGPTLAEIFAQSQRGPEEMDGDAQAAVAIAPPGIPDATEPVPAPTASALELGPVQAVLPSLRVTGVADPGVAAAVAQVPGVVSAAAAEVGEVVLGEGQATRAVTVAAVDPLAFRPLTPQVTAEEPAVWQRLLEGDAAFTHDVGNRLGVPLGSVVPAGEGQTLRIGAYASNGIPPVADALVSTATADAVGLDGRVDVYVSVAEGTDVAGVAQAIAAVAGAAPEVLEQPQQQRAFLTGSAAQEFFEPFTYIDHGDGLITIDADWVARNIVSADVPVFTGQVTCHRQFVEQLRGALQEIVDLGLDHLIDPSQYGGCWVARHIDWRPDRPLSMHAWGLAIDFNVSTNQLGATPTMDPRIVEVFDRWGFVWGGRWSRPDGMHFELGAVLQ